MYWNSQMGTWWQVLATLGFVLFWAAVITLIVLLARSLRANQARGQGWGAPSAAGPGQPQGWAAAPRQPGWAPPPPAMPPGQHAAMHAGPGAEDVLAERFARGEIDEAEFKARLDVLRQQRGGAS